MPIENAKEVRPMSYMEFVNFSLEKMHRELSILCLEMGNKIDAAIGPEKLDSVATPAIDNPVPQTLEQATSKLVYGLHEEIEALRKQIERIEKIIG